MPNDDYIKRSEAVARLTGKACCVNSQGKVRAFSTAINMIVTMPSADVEPVVRCGNCQFFENVKYWPDGTKKVCQLLRRQVLENSFCCWGMKKEAEDAEQADQI